jgi:hypothetical protein
MAEDAVAAGVHRGGSLGPGTIIGPYQIETQIGRGGMSTVFAARHVALDRLVALKVLLPSLAGDGEFVSRFLAEARAAARLDHPHIVPVYDTGEIGGINYIAMKLLDGSDLRAILEHQRSAGYAGLPLDRAARIIGQAAAALDYAHQHRVVHRDVKPANIYVDASDGVTLVDFGIARALDRASSTLTGAVIGTPAYMSPEQALGLPADFRSDIYSLGVVLYEALSGAPPFTGSPHSVMNAHANSSAPPLAERRPDVPAAVEGIVQRALAKRPEDRFQTAGALANALEQAAGGRSTPLGAPVQDDGSTAVYSEIHLPEIDAASTPRGTKRRALFPLAAGAALAIIAAIAAGALVFGPLGAKDGRLAVNSDPTGAAVTVDGHGLGVTPLAAHAFTAGSHELSLDMPGYVPVKRTEQLHTRTTDTVNATLTVLPASELLTVQQAVVAKDIAQGPNNTITVGSPITSVHINEEFGMVVTVLPKPIAPHDISFRQEMALLDPSGNRLAGSAPSNATVGRGDNSGRVFAFTFHFNANSDGSIPAGTYQLQFLVDGQAMVSRPITLVS